MKHKIIILFFLFSILNYSQSFKATVDRTSVGQNEQFQVYFTLENAQGKNVSFPNFKGFNVLAGPNQSTSMSIINNQVTQSATYSFVLSCSNMGDYTIGSASIVVNGETLTTQSIKITVGKGKTQQQIKQEQNQDTGVSEDDIAKNVFIRAIPSKTSILQGDQLTITYKLYTRYNMATPQISNLPKFNGFWAEELTMPKQLSFTPEMYNGQRYNAVVLQKVALFPTKTGTLSVTPFELEIPVLIQKKRQSRDIFDSFFNDPFFNTTETYNYKAKSNTVNVNVQSLPDNAPSSFTGAVGDFKLESNIEKTELKTNEPFTLKFILSGTGNIKLLSLPKLNLPVGFETYEPKTSDNINRGGVISGSKTIEYLIVPRIPGKKEIPSIEFSYFNPVSKQYVTLKTPTYSLNIEKGEGEYDPSISGFSKEDVKLLSEDIRYIKTSSYDFQKKEDFTLIKPWFIFSMIIPFIGFIVFVGIKKRNDKFSGNAQLLKYQKAEKNAKAKLKSAKFALSKNELSNFYSELSIALFGYLENKLNIQKSEFTLELAVLKLKTKNVNNDIISRLKTTSEKCEFARFAPSTLNIDDANLLYEDTIKLIVELENSITNNKKKK
ncbi:MAG: protein BatD [Ignavibacteriales bacterium]|nr:protein BatD [Ignavibacteriales bacterium]